MAMRRQAPEGADLWPARNFWDYDFVDGIGIESAADQTASISVLIHGGWSRSKRLIKIKPLALARWTPPSIGSARLIMRLQPFS